MGRSKGIYKQFSAKPKAAALNWDAASAGYDWAKQNLTKRDPYRLERMDGNQGKIIVEGNAAAALGAVFGGVSVITWYPITPSSSLAEAAQGYLNRFRIDESTGKATFAVVQAEDELASIGMAIGGRLGRCAGHDPRPPARAFRDVGVRRTGALRGNPGGADRCAAHGAFDGPGRRALRKAPSSRRQRSRTATRFTPC